MNFRIPKSCPFSYNTNAKLTVIAFTGGLLGILFMIPMRKVFIVSNQEQFNKVKKFITKDIILISIEDVLNNRNYPISIGGDHSITYPIISAYGKIFPRINIVHFDAHPE